MSTISTDEWVRRLNALGREMDDLAASLHPSVWGEALADLRARYEKLARQPTCDDKQLPLFAEEPTDDG